MAKYYFTARDAADYVKTSEVGLARFRRRKGLPCIKRQGEILYEYGPEIVALRRELAKGGR